MNKKEYRKNAIAKRNSLSHIEIITKSKAIAEKLFSMESYRKASNILVYCSYKTEVETYGIIDKALQDGKEVYCPKITDPKNGKMEFAKIDSIDDLEENAMSIPEPIDDNFISASNTDKSTLMLMPGTAFDKKLNRIGYGGGFYDRYLQNRPQIQTIALSYDCQMFDEVLPTEDSDIKPKMIITESKIIQR